MSNKGVRNRVPTDYSTKVSADPFFLHRCWLNAKRTRKKKRKKQRLLLLRSRRWSAKLSVRNSDNIDDNDDDLPLIAANVICDDARCFRQCPKTQPFILFADDVVESVARILAYVPATAWLRTTVGPHFIHPRPAH